MDIDLLSKMVKELIMDQDRVVLPGLGCFVAEIVPSTFSDKGYTINPPYRRLFFRAKPDEGDDLTSFYASSNKVDPGLAERIIRDFLAELKTVLYEKKTVVFPGLGRLRATKENHLFFVADEDLDIYPEGFGLEPVSLKTHQETPEQVSAAVVDLKAMLTEPETRAPFVEIVSVPEPVSEPVQDQGQAPEQDQDLVQEPSQEAVSVAEPDPTPAADTPEPAAAPEPVVIPEPIQEPEPILGPAPEPIPEPIPVLEPEESSYAEDEEICEEAVEAVQQKPAKSLWKVILKIIIWVVVVAVILLAAYVVAGHMFPEIVDRILYTPEEMEIVNIL